MTVKKIVMPKLGESVTEGTINSWLVEVGDQVNKYDPIAEVMTDKVNAEVPSTFSGTIKEIVAGEGETVAVGDLICYIEVKADEQTIAKTTIVETDQKDKDELHEEKEKSMKHRYSPAVLKLANEHNIDLSSIKGTGLGGRITRKDVYRYIEQQKKQTETAHQQVTTAERIQPVSKQDIEIPVTGVRKIIAQNMIRSKQEIPHAWMTVEVDVTDLVTYRKKIKNRFKAREGFSLTYFPFFVHAVSSALREFPELNSTWAGDKIIQRNEINISIAVAKENELYVPVIKHADEKSIKGIAKEIDRLAKKTRNNELTPEDMKGGTFTVNNTGTFGSISSMGIINYPQAALLQVETIVKRPVIINNMFAARDIVNLSLSLDHRVLDGLICGRFLQRVKQILENMNEQTIQI